MTQLIKLQDKFILVSDEDAKNNELLYNIENNTICRAMGDAEVSHFKIIAGVEFLPSIDFSLLSETDCKKIGFVNVEKLALEAFKQGITFSHKEFSDNAYYRFRTWFSQTKTAQSLNDNKFSEQQVIEIVEKSRATGLTAEYLILSLQQTSWDVKVEMEEDGDCEVGGREFINYSPKITNNSIKILRIL